MLSFLGSSDAAQVILCVTISPAAFSVLLTRVSSTMGIFPIIMNVVQFWLIDSIVKANASSQSTSPSSATRHSDDREPLFRANSDDEDDDDDDDRRPNDIENPPSTDSPAFRGDTFIPATPAESKLSVQTQTAAGSGTSSPKVVDRVGSHAMTMHAYPPVGSTSTSPVSPASLLSPASSISNMSPSTKRRRRSPPPPLSLAPRVGFPAVVVTPQIRQPVPKQKSVVDTLVEDEKSEWAAWGDDATDDWADKVGEEDWTGRRIAHKVESLHDVWATHEEFRPTAIQAA